MPTQKGVILEQTWIGRLSNDIVRPDGQVAVKATGKEFETHVCMVMTVEDDGRIRTIHEYYNRAWDDGKHESKYAVMRA